MREIKANFVIFFRFNVTEVEIITLPPSLEIDEYHEVFLPDKSEDISKCESLSINDVPLSSDLLALIKHEFDICSLPESDVNGKFMHLLMFTNVFSHLLM